MKSGTIPLQQFLLTVLACYCLASVVFVGLHSDSLQWDFKTYYYAGHAFLAGMNPYSLADISSLTSTPLEFRFIYPPHSLLVFAPLATFSPVVSSILFLVLKTVFLAGLLVVWRRSIIPELSGPLFYFFCLLAFNSTIYRDFASGNISVFEQLGLWLAFSFYLRKKLAAFSSFIVITASFKLTPILFLGLLLVSDDPRRRTYLIVSSAAFLLLFGASYLISPFLFSQFIENLNQPAGHGTVNPSTLQFFQDSASFISRNLVVDIPPLIPIVLYLGVVLSILLSVGKYLTSLTSRSWPGKDRFILLFLCVAYALVLPRFKDYSYILLVVPCYYIFKQAPSIASSTLLIVFSMVSNSVPLPWAGFIAPLWKYSPLLVASLVFFLYAQEGNRIVTRIGSPASGKTPGPASL